MRAYFETTPIAIGFTSKEELDRILYFFGCPGKYDFLQGYISFYKVVKQLGHVRSTSDMRYSYTGLPFGKGYGIITFKEFDFLTCEESSFYPLTQNK